VKLSAVKFKKGEKPDVEFGHRVRCRKWSIKSVCELRKRRYQLSGLAIELFLKNGATFLLTFPSTKIRDEAFNALQSLIYPDYCELDVSISQAQRDMQRELVCGGDSGFNVILTFLFMN
jgi:hypothetical protein